MSVLEPALGSFTKTERAAWDKIADAANAMFALPEVHPADNGETVRDIHNLQNRLLARAAYPTRGAEPEAKPRCECGCGGADGDCLERA